MFRVFAVIVPLAFYLFIEALFFGGIISVFWKYFLYPKFGIELLYWDWVGIVLGVKLLITDIFKVLANISKIYVSADTITKNNAEINE